VVVDVTVSNSKLVVVVGLAVYVVVVFPAIVIVFISVGGSGARLLIGLLIVAARRSSICFRAYRWSFLLDFSASWGAIPSGRTTLVGSYLNHGSGYFCLRGIVQEGVT